MSNISVKQTQILSKLYEECRRRMALLDDLAHGWEHVRRVYQVAMLIAEQEEANIFIVGAAALLHDLGRTRPDKGRHHAEISVEIARELLEPYMLPPEQLTGIVHAIAAHSYKHGVEARTLEARVLRDADRLDSIGALGIMRWAVTGTKKHIPYSYHPDDPFGEQRELNEKKYLLDQFYKKFLTVQDVLTTDTARELARGRVEFMHAYLEELKQELHWS